MPNVSAIVLAAGLSSRFGGANKVLSLWQGQSMVSRVVQTLRECAVHIIVVTGRDADAVAAEVAPARTVFNPAFESGMGSSIAAGVASLPPCDGILIALADMPDLRRDVVADLLDALTDAAIVVPIYADDPERPGHPVLFSTTFRTELELLTGDEGARSILRAHADKIVRVPVPGRLDDLDFLAP